MSDTIHLRSSLVRTCISDCPLRWRLDAQAVEEGRAVEAAWNIMGTALHSTIFVAIQNPDLTPRQLFDYMNAALDEYDWEALVYSDSRPDEESVRNAAEDCLTSFIHYWNGGSEGFRPTEPGEVASVILVEETLSVPLDDDVVVETTPDLILYVGPMGSDVPDRWRVVDWKTGASTSSNPMQLWIYWWIAKQVGVVPEGANFEGEFVHLSHRRVQRHSIYPGDGVVEAWMRTTAEMVRRDLWYPRSGWYCSYCPHVSICPLHVGATTITRR